MKTTIFDYWNKWIVRLKSVKNTNDFLNKVKKTLPTISRVVLTHELRAISKQIGPIGHVLDIGSMASPYTKFFNYSERTTLELNSLYRPSVVADAHSLPFSDKTFDSVLITEVLEHIRSPQRVVNEIYRILKKGGMCLLSTRFIYPYHACPNDFYRFTQDSLTDLFRQYSKVEIYAHGNTFLSIWELFTEGFPFYFFRLVNPLLAHISCKSKAAPLGFIVLVHK